MHKTKVHSSKKACLRPTAMVVPRRGKGYPPRQRLTPNIKRPESAAHLHLHTLCNDCDQQTACSVISICSYALAPAAMDGTGPSWGSDGHAANGRCRASSCKCCSQKPGPFFASLQVDGMTASTTTPYGVLLVCGSVCWETGVPHARIFTNPCPHDAMTTVGVWPMAGLPMANDAPATVGSA